MIVEIAIIIVIIILVITELIKYTIMPYFNKNDIHNDYLCAQESFIDNKIIPNPIYMKISKLFT